jgi:hypothetical protein
MEDMASGRPEEAGDYEYDLAHERPEGAAPAPRHDERPGRAPEHRPVEFDQDMSYDEAHDF